MRLFASLVALATVLAATTASAAPLSLRFIGQQTLPTGTQFGGTTVGGLSGLDYLGAGQYVAISDDRSQINPARFYTLDLALTEAAFTGVSFTGTTTLKTPGGGTYPALSIDPEAIRVRANGNYIYTSEGDVNNNINAFIREANANGDYVRDIAVPAAFQQSGPAGTTGPRNNLAFESITLASGGGRFVTATENALRQDGPTASLGVASPVRLLSLNAATGAAGSQFVYNVEAITTPSNPANGFATNGLVELLDLGGGKLLAVERSFVAGRVSSFSATGNSIQLYEIDTNGSTDVSGLASLAGESFTPVAKTLLFDLDTLGIPLDNVEAITFGEILPNGSRSLILASDNNFSPAQFTQFLAFEVGGVPEPSSWAMLVIGFGLIGGTLRRRVARSLAA